MAQLNGFKRNQVRPEAGTPESFRRVFRFVFIPVSALAATFLLNFGALVWQVKDAEQPLCRGDRKVLVNWLVGKDYLAEALEAKGSKQTALSTQELGVSKPPIFVIGQSLAGFFQSYSEVDFSQARQHQSLPRFDVNLRPSELVEVDNQKKISFSDILGILDEDFCESFILVGGKDWPYKHTDDVATPSPLSTQNLTSSFQLKHVWISAVFNQQQQTQLQASDQSYESIRIGPLIRRHLPEEYPFQISVVTNRASEKNFGIICGVRNSSFHRGSGYTRGNLTKILPDWETYSPSETKRALRDQVVKQSELEASICAFALTEKIAPHKSIVPSFLASNWNIEAINTPIRRALFSYDRLQYRLAVNLSSFLFPQ